MIAREELQKLEGKATNDFLLPDIVIQIDKNCANPYAILRSELEHARDIAKREVPDQSKKHFNRYNGLNESEMSLEYVKKKADTRAGKEVTEAEKTKQYIDEAYGELGNKSPEENLNTFITNKDISLSKVDKLINDEAYKSTGVLDEYKDIPIRKMTDDEIAKENGNPFRTLAEIVTDEKGGILIKVNPNASAEDIEFCVLHEIRHLQQDPVAAKELEDLAANIKTKEDMLNYISHPLEKDADEWAYNTLKAKKEYYARKTKDNEVTSNQPESASNLSRDENRRGDSSLDVGESTGSKPSISDTTNRPITERINQADNPLGEVDKVVCRSGNA